MKSILNQNQTKYFKTPAENLSAYVVEPQKVDMSRKQIKQTIVDTLQSLYRGDTVDMQQFKKAIAGAKDKKFDLSKIKVNYYWKEDYNFDDKTYSPIKYAAFNFFANEKGFHEVLRYLIANTQPEKVKNEVAYTLGDMFSDWHGDDMHYVYDGAQRMSPEFVKTFKLLKDHGASIKDFDRNIAYLQTKLYQNPEFVDMLLQLENTEINWTLSHMFYEVTDYQTFFEMINKYDLKEFSVEQAIHKIDGSSKKAERVKFLIDQGKLDIKDFTDEKLKQTMENMYFYSPLEDIMLEANINKLKQEYAPSDKDDKNIQTKNHFQPKQWLTKYTKMQLLI